MEHPEQTELALYFQPQFSGTELRITGFEALLRWRHPTRGFVPPSVFIPIAEESGLIIALGRWVLQQACAEAVRWRPGVRVAINVSPPQLKDDQFLHDVVDTLARTGLAPHLLEVEVTESVLVEDDEHVLRIMRELRARHISIALDDFGTGYSSLSYLRRFPFDKIKIDRSFIDQLTTEASAQAIMAAILLMGRSLDLEVIAEGIETPQQLALVHRMGCSEVQGFLVGRPMPADEVPGFLRQQQARQSDARASSREYDLAS
jgi:EAL domain-containing protein (putative c-di-GMP-specific phosphodiesterase class I)